MPSVIDICNRALSHTGTDQTIASLDEKSKEARLCARWYEHSRDMLLRDMQPSFAQRRVALANMGEPPAGWEYRYRYPTECLMLHEVYDPEWYDPRRLEFQGRPFDVASSGDGGRVILTNVKAAEARYTARITDPNLQPVDFTATLELLLAANICMPLLADPNMAKYLSDRATLAINQAKTADMNEAREFDMPEAEWIRDRFGNTGQGYYG
ncbi:hypothetical protein DFO67_10414 [Modicisalibacter xianhensis]|uniref:Uncharacterized protein n=1 Tax=Modicisalibacter xianhensis TaxID=442341 RepID=A0A4R8G662_9GAMM|nr:hypothetical protein [Halomonas xianhensis]TDX30759.1 hypothetical protein DFO67_10414 [Halomonas xianhensis]